MATLTPENQFSTADMISEPINSTKPALDPAVAGAVAGANGPAAQAPVSTQEGVGSDGEFDVWKGHYSAWNFLGRIIGAILLTIGWVVLASYINSGRASGRNPSVFLWITGGVVAFVWLVLVQRMVFACAGHSYRLSNRRLFISTGVLRRRRNQIELLRVQDVSSKQSLGERMLSIGTVEIVSSDPHFPNLYLLGIPNPQATMDEVWNRARAERDKRSVKVDAL